MTILWFFFMSVMNIFPKREYLNIKTPLTW